MDARVACAQDEPFVAAGDRMRDVGVHGEGRVDRVGGDAGAEADGFVCTSKGLIASWGGLSAVIQGVRLRGGV